MRISIFVAVFAASITAQTVKTDERPYSCLAEAIKEIRFNENADFDLAMNAFKSACRGDKGIGLYDGWKTYWTVYSDCRKSEKLFSQAKATSIDEFEHIANACIEYNKTQGQGDSIYSIRRIDISQDIQDAAKNNLGDIFIRDIGLIGCDEEECDYKVHAIILPRTIATLIVARGSGKIKRIEKVILDTAENNRIAQQIQDSIEAQQILIRSIKYKKNKAAIDKKIIKCLKGAANDPNAVQLIKASVYEATPEKTVYRVDMRGKNGFGALVLGTTDVIFSGDVCTEVTPVNWLNY